LKWLNKTRRPDDAKDADMQRRLAEIEAEMGSLGPYKAMTTEQRKRANLLQHEKDRLLHPESVTSPEAGA